MLRRRWNIAVVTHRLTMHATASVVAVLIGSAIFTTLPIVRPGHSTVELTSGGKFAARIPDAAGETGPDESVTDRPAVAPLAPLLADAAVPPPTDGWATSLLDQPLRGKTRLVHAAALRSVADVPPLPVARPTGTPMLDLTPASSDDGILARAAASARSMLSLSAAAGSAFISRLTP